MPRVHLLYGKSSQLRWEPQLPCTQQAPLPLPALLPEQGYGDREGEMPGKDRLN